MYLIYNPTRILNCSVDRLNAFRRRSWGSFRLGIRLITFSLQSKHLSPNEPEHLGPQ
jgi:hypothetical protein